MSDDNPSSADPLGAITDEFVEAFRQGKHPSVEEFVRRYPACADELREMLPALLLMEQAKSTTDTSAKGRQAADRTLAESEEYPEVPGYQILDICGQGGMGVVYRARQLGANRLVALKMIRAVEHASPHDRVRFQIETEAVARLQHPNIVQLHEVGEVRGQPFFSLEYCDGGTLIEQLKRQPPTPREAAGLIETLARAIHYAHLRGVVHRDLKPGNVLLAACGLAGSNSDRTAKPQAAEVVPKITDFGLAKRIDAEARDISQSGAIVGTASYMAPEQAAGRVRDTGPAADVYALGALLYECLAGRPPFEGPQAVVLVSVVVDEPMPPSRRRANVPVDLETICLKCLRKEPGRRYASAAELADDLGRFLHGEPITARPVGRVERTALWVRRKPASAALVLALVLLIVAVVTFSSLLAVREHRAASILAESNQELIHTQGEREAALKQARQESARVALDRGLHLCEAGDVGLGLIYLTRSLDRAVKAEDIDLESAIRLNLAAWERQHWSLRNYREGAPGAHVWSAALSPRGSPLAVALANKTVELWDLREGREAQTLHSLPHGETVAALVFSGDGGLLLTRTDRTVRVWNVASGQLACSPLVHPNNLTAAAFSGDGKWVLTGSGNPNIRTDNVKQATARLWQTDTGTCVASSSHKVRVTAVAFSPRGDLALTGDGLGVVQLWKLPSGDAVGSPLLHTGMIQSAVFSPDGGRILTGTSAGTVHVWQVQPARQVFLPVSGSAGDLVMEVAFSPDGQRFVARTNLGRAYLWRADTANPVAAPLAHHGRVESLAFSPDSRTLLTGGAGGFAQGWDASQGQPIGPLLAHLDRVRECSFSRDGQSIITVDGTVRRWQAPTGLRRGPPLDHQGLVRAVAFSPDGRSLLTGSLDGFARLWDSARPAEAPRLLKQGSGINAVAFSPDGRFALSGGLNGEAILWDVPGGALRTRFKGHAAAVYAVTFSHDGKTALTGAADGTARLWDVATLRPVAVLPHTGMIWAVAFSPDDRHALTGSMGGTAALWDLSARPAVVRSLPHEGGVQSVAFSPDGQTAITADVKSGSIRLWETSTGTLVRTLRGHALGIQAVAVSPDGQYLVSGSSDRTARLWKLATGESIGMPLQHQAPVRHVAFSPDGRSVYTGSEDNTARRWHVPTGLPIGPAFVHRQKVQVVAVHPESTLAATGSWDQTVGLWEAPDPRSGSPAQLARWAEKITGIRLDDSGSLRVLTGAEWEGIR